MAPRATTFGPGSGQSCPTTAVTSQSLPSDDDPLGVAVAATIKIE